MIHSNFMIWLNGPPGVGKDTTVRYMVEEFTRRKYSTGNISSIDPVRRIAQTEFGLDPLDKSPENRKFLATLGDLLEDYCHYKSDYVVNQTSLLFGSAYWSAAFVHVRERKIIDRIVEKMDGLGRPYNFRTVYVASDARGVRNPSNENDAEALNPLGYHYRIQNDASLADLRDQASRLVQQILTMEIEDHG